MTAELQTALRDEQEGPANEERELEEAEKTFAEETGNETRAVSNPKDLPYTIKQNQQILTALGFTRYEDPGVIKYNVRVMNIKIGVTFNETNPLGKVWAYTIPEGDEEKGFLKNGELKDHPIIQKYHAIQEGKEPMPEISVTGKIIEKRGKAIKVEIEENGEKIEIFFGQGAVKKDAEGYFIPAGFSKAGKEHDAKMSVPRDIRLLLYETQLSQAPVADTTKEKEVPKEKGEAQPTEKTTLDEVIHKEQATLAEGEKPTVDYYISLIGEITVKVKAEERISKGEQGYAISKVFDAITRDTRTALIAELKNGGDHEE